jgi:SSS family solute:Na+ symporter
MQPDLVPVESYIRIAIAVFILYVILNIFIGYYGSTKTKTAKDYYFASHTVGPWAIALAYGATCYSATLIIGYGGLSYNIGSSMIWIAATNIFIMTYLAWVVLGKRVRKMQESLDAYTVMELLTHRYKSPHVRPFLAVIVMFSMMAYSVAVLTGTARLFQVIFDIKFLYALIIIVVVIGFYITIGGIISTIYANFLQGGVMLLGMVVLLVGVLYKTGFSSAYESLAEFGTEYVTMPGTNTWWFLISLCLVTSLIPWGMPQIISMLYSAKNVRAIRLAVPIVTVWSFVILYTIYFTGPTARVILGSGVEQDVVMPSLFRAILPPLGIGVVLSAVVAASMSTASATTLQASFALSRDFLQPFFPEKISDETILTVSKYTTVLMVIIAFGLSYLQLGTIADIFNFGAAASCAAFVPPLVCALFWKRGTSKAILASTILGFLTVLLWTLVFGLRGQGFYGIQAIIPGQVVGWLVFVGVSLTTEQLPKEHIEKAMKY